jgi:hypothetical protein
VHHGTRGNTISSSYNFFITPKGEQMAVAKEGGDRAGEGRAYGNTMYAMLDTIYAT